MSDASTSWGSLPAEIRNQVLGILPGLGGVCSQLATVSREWQSVFEPLNFAEISLTLPRLSDPQSRDILFRKRSLVRYIWFRVELQQYGCEDCHVEPVDPLSYQPQCWTMSKDDIKLILEAFQSLFSALSQWEPHSNLVLDISIYSPSDAQHRFKYLSLHPDTHFGECPSLHQQQVPIEDSDHGWVGGRQLDAPDVFAIEKVSTYFMGDDVGMVPMDYDYMYDTDDTDDEEELPFKNKESEGEWWDTLPVVPAIAVVLFRQQTRRRWDPITIGNMLMHFPNLKELCWEPWRNLLSMIEEKVDQRTRREFQLVSLLSHVKPFKLTIFENFNQSYPRAYAEFGFGAPPAMRVPAPAVSHNLARASLQLATLSASFMVDAGYFFKATKPSWKWENLTSLALTSRVLVGDADVADINDMLRDAAAAALKMPKIETVELWNGRQGTAMLFRYQKARNGQSAIITVRGTFTLALESTVTQAWDAVALHHGHGSVIVQSSLIDPSLIGSHGDAICQLGLSTDVVRPISLRQILQEHELQAATRIPPP